MLYLDHHVLERLPARERPVDSDVKESQKALFRRAQSLRKHDRLLLQMALQNGMSRRQIAAILEVPAGTVTRRLQRLGALLHDPLVVMLTDPKCPLPPDYRQIAIERIVQRRKVGELAELHQISPAKVKEMLVYVKGWFRGYAQRR